MDSSLFFSSGRFFATRLGPGDDLKETLIDMAGALDLSAISVITCVGSLSSCVLRMAGQKEPEFFSGDYEIVSLTGTLCRSGVHLHLAISDNSGTTIGGHLVGGARIRTTAEIILVGLPDINFDRKLDPETGYRELLISRKV